MATCQSASGTAEASAGGPSPYSQNNFTVRPLDELTPWSLEVLTVNINSWGPFKERWTNEGEPAEIQSATVMLLQETHLVTDVQCSDATEWLESRGWLAVFRPAQMQDSGKSSGGVSVCVRKRADIGVTLPDLVTEEPHRLLAVKLEVTGLPTMMLVSAYFQAAVGLNKLNRTLLATVASWQEEQRLPVLIGGRLQRQTADGSGHGLSRQGGDGGGGA